MPRRGGRAEGKCRGQHDAYWTRISRPGAVGHRQSARAARGNVEALSSQPVGRALVSPVAPADRELIHLIIILRIAFGAAVSRGIQTRRGKKAREGLSKPAP